MVVDCFLLMWGCYFIVITVHPQTSKGMQEL